MPGYRTALVRLLPVNVNALFVCQQILAHNDTSRLMRHLPEKLLSYTPKFGLFLLMTVETKEYLLSQKKNFLIFYTDNRALKGWYMLTMGEAHR